MTVWKNKNLRINTSKEYSRNFYIEDIEAKTCIHLPKTEVQNILDAFQACAEWSDESNVFLREKALRNEITYWKDRCALVENASIRALDLELKYKEMGELIQNKTNDFNLGIQNLLNELKKIWLVLNKNGPDRKTAKPVK